MGCALVVLGIFGYRGERRRRGAAGVRQFLFWYAFAWPFMAAAMIGVMYPRLRWILFVSYGAVAIGYLIQFRKMRRARKTSRLEQDSGNS